MITPKTAFELQPAFDKSGLTGEPVFLSGIFSAPGSLSTNGATIQCPSTSIMGNWNVGTGQIRFKAGNGLNVTAHSTSNKSPVLENLVLVCSHADSQEAAGLTINCAGAVVRNPIIDGAGQAVLFAPKSIGAQFDNLYVRGAFTAGIASADPSTTSDHYFGGQTFISGKTHDDYGRQPQRKFQFTNYAVRGWPNSTVMEYLLANDCRVGVRLDRHIHGVLKCGFFDSHRGPVFEVAQEYSGKDVIREFTVQTLHAAATEKSQSFWALDGKTSQVVRVMELAVKSTFQTAGTWDMTVPDGVVVR